MQMKIKTAEENTSTSCKTSPEFRQSILTVKVWDYTYLRTPIKNKSIIYHMFASILEYLFNNIYIFLRSHVKWQRQSHHKLKIRERKERQHKKMLATAFRIVCKNKVSCLVINKLIGYIYKYFISFFFK